MRAAAYVRVSTAGQAAEGLSLDAQEGRVRAYIEHAGWTLVEVYVEAGVSGRRDSRPALDRLLESLDAIDVLVIPRLDRLGRNARGMLDLFARLKAAGVRLVSTEDGIDTGTSAGGLLPNLMAVLAEYESEVLGERVRGVTEARVRDGRHHGRPPFGYGVGMAPIEAEAVVVVRLYEEAAAGLSQRASARRLNAEGIPTQRGRDWTQGTVRKVLANPAYRGANTIKGAEHPGNHEPIVSDDLWGAVASNRAAAARTPGGGRGRPPAGRHLFTRGLLRCGLCHAAMAPRTRANRAEPDQEIYECLGRKNRGPDHCDQGPIPRAPIDSAAFEYFARLGLDLDAMRAALRAAVEAKAAEVGALTKQAEADERAAAGALAKVDRDYTHGSLSAEHWGALRGPLQGEHDGAVAKLGQLRARGAEVAAAAEAAGDAEGDAVARVAEIRAAVAGEIEAADGLAGVRVALLRMFEAFYVTEAPDREWEPGEEEVARDAVAEIEAEAVAEGSQTFSAPGWVIMPRPRPEVVEGIDEEWWPILRKDAEGLIT
ncbi:MAG: recombinase family protein [Thermoleophilaceae bacterium]